MRNAMVFCAAVVIAGCGGSPRQADSASVELTGETLAAEPRASRRGTDAAPCTDTAAFLLARAVILAAPIVITADDMYLNDGRWLRAFVDGWRRFFETGGGAVTCASVAGPRLIAAGIQLYEPRAYDRVMSTAPPEIAHLSGEVADRINSSSSYMFELGQELSWLGQVLPSVAGGDLGPFLNTGYPIRNEKRQMLAAVWPSLQAMCSMGDCRETLALALPQMSRLVDEIALGMTYSMIMLAQQR